MKLYHKIILIALSLTITSLLFACVPIDDEEEGYPSGGRDTLIHSETDDSLLF